MSSLKLQKRLAADVMKCGKKKVKSKNIRQSRYIWTQDLKMMITSLNPEILWGLSSSTGLINCKLMLVDLPIYIFNPWHLSHSRCGLIPTRSMRSPTPTPGPTSGSWSRMVSSSRSPWPSTPGPGWGLTTRPGGRDVTVALERGREQLTPGQTRRSSGCRGWECSGGFSRDTGMLQS